MSAKRIEQGRVVAAFGRQRIVELSDGTQLACLVRGRRTGIACGDRVEVQRLSAEQGVIEKLLPRASLLYRCDAFKQKLLAANVTQAIVLLAPVPSYSVELLDRCLTACEATGIRALIALNKADLVEEIRRAQAELEPYRALGYPLVTLSAKRSVEPLREHLHGQTSILVGQSGMGKSTVINALVPDARARTDEISAALNSGRHTTTAARLYHLDGTSHIIDSPGLQEFGLFHLSDEEIAHALPEFRPHLGRCRFNDCRHLAEPDCAVQAATEAGAIHPRRLDFYRKLIAEHDGQRARVPVKRRQPA